MLMLSSASLTVKNYFLCMIVILLGSFLKKLSSASWPPLFLANMCIPLPTLLFLGSIAPPSQDKNSIFSSAKRTGSPSHWAKYHSYCNKTLTYLKDLKSKFFHNLFTSPSPWSFWSAVKRINSKPGSIPFLIHNGSPVTHSLLKHMF